MNNEFAEDLVLSSSRVKKRVNERGGRSIPKTTSFTTKAEPGLIGNQDGTKKLAQDSMGYGSVKGLRSYPMEIERNWH